MKEHHTSMAVALALPSIVAIYFGGYFASVTWVQVSFGNSSGPLVALYAHPWQQTLFNPVEQIDRRLFPARWRYDQLRHTDTATR